MSYFMNYLNSTPYFTTKMAQKENACRQFGVDLPALEPLWPFDGAVDDIRQTLDEIDGVPLEYQMAEQVAPPTDAPDVLFDFGFDPTTPPSMPTEECTSLNEDNPTGPVQNTFEAFGFENENSSVPTSQPIEPTPGLSGGCVILDTFFSSKNDYMAPAPVKKPLRAPKVKPESAHVQPKVIKKKNTDRVTVEQSFKVVLDKQRDPTGRYILPKAIANEIAEKVFAGQIKISLAGHPSKGKSPKRTAYTRLHDALNKAKWTREVVGEIYYYSKH